MITFIVVKSEIRFFVCFIYLAQMDLLPDSMCTLEELCICCGREILSLIVSVLSLCSSLFRDSLISKWFYFCLLSKSSILVIFLLLGLQSKSGKSNSFPFLLPVYHLSTMQVFVSHGTEQVFPVCCRNISCLLSVMCICGGKLNYN